MNKGKPKDRLRVADIGPFPSWERGPTDKSTEEWANELLAAHDAYGDRPAPKNWKPERRRMYLYELLKTCAERSEKPPDAIWRLLSGELGLPADFVLHADRYLRGGPTQGKERAHPLARDAAVLIDALAVVKQEGRPSHSEMVRKVGEVLELPPHA